MVWTHFVESMLSDSRPAGVVIIQPFHEMYVNQSLVFGIHPIIVSMRDLSHSPSNVSHDVPMNASDLWELDFDEIEKAIDNSPVPVKGFIFNSPHNPTGKVFTDEVGCMKFCPKTGSVPKLV